MMLGRITAKLHHRLVHIQWLSSSTVQCRTFHVAFRQHARAVPELTKIRYPSVTRGNFGSLTDDDMNRFKTILPDSGQILTDNDELLPYNTDWMGIYRGSSNVVLRPKSTIQVSEILKYCNNRQLAVVPQGGNTGLVGGSIPVFDEVIINMQLMNHITNLDKIAGILTCQSGCILEHLDNELAKDDYMMPLDLGAKGSCQIGGNVSTNAGGIRLLRYGSLHGNVLGLEAVLANGEVVDCLSAMRKDNTGYDMKHLFIGSEGTLGVVTAVAILCPRRSTSVNVAFLACESFDAVLQLLSAARSQLNEILSAFEFLDDAAMNSATRHLHVSNPIKPSPFYVLVETSGSSTEHDEQKLNVFLEGVMSSNLAVDGTLATEPSKIKALWQIRETIALGLLEDGHCYKYDISLPLADYYSVVEVMRPRLAGLAKVVCGYGHVGDGNLHFNVTSSKYNPDLVKLIEPFLYEFVSERRGSISAEHGIGFAKRKHLHYSRSASTIQLMQRLKSVLDPNGILNPYKTLPPVDTVA